MGFSSLSEEVKALVKSLSGEYGIDIDLDEHGVEYLPIKGDKGTSEQRINSMITALENLVPGKTYLHVEHPALDVQELQAIYHIGYTDVGIERQGVTDAWTSPKVKEVLEKKNIKLISYGDLRKVD